MSDPTPLEPGRVAVWAPPDMSSGAPHGAPKAASNGAPHGSPQGAYATVAALADLQAEAYKEGFEQGRVEGRVAGNKEAQAQVARLAGLFHDLAKPFEVLDQEVDGELLQLAMALARQIVRRELKADPTQIIGIIRDAIAALPVAAREVRVHLHPEDAAVVREHLAPTESERAWTIVEDPVMARGGCEIKTATSRIDARLEVRLGAILSELLGTERQADSPRVAGVR
jgi:flagellar assembly protein FliH